MYQVIETRKGKKYPMSVKFKTVEEARLELTWWKECFPSDSFSIICYCI